MTSHYMAKSLKHKIFFEYRMRMTRSLVIFEKDWASMRANLACCIQTTKVQSSLGIPKSDQHLCYPSVECITTKLDACKVSVI